MENGRMDAFYFKHFRSQDTSSHPVLVHLLHIKVSELCIDSICDGGLMPTFTQCTSVYDFCETFMSNRGKHGLLLPWTVQLIVWGNSYREQPLPWNAYTTVEHFYILISKFIQNKVLLFWIFSVLLGQLVS